MEINKKFVNLDTKLHSMKTVSIIILSYNTSELLRKCLTSLFIQLRDQPFEVIVVDNASTDDSVSMVKKDFKQVRVIENTENVGFAKGCNRGAQDSKSEYLLFLNSDTEVLLPDILEKLTALFEDPTVGIAGGLMINPDNSYQRSFGNFYTLPHVAKMLFLGEKSEISSQKFHSIQKTDWVSGGFMMVKKSVFDQVKGFDEGYFMYVEDVDLCYKVTKAGYSVVIDPSIQIHHIGQGSSNRTFAIVHIYKGLNRFYKLHRSSVEYLSLRVLLFLKAYLVMLFATIKGDHPLKERYKQAITSL